MKATNVLDIIGNTPHIRVNKLYSSDYEVWVKFEKSNPGGSIKDRIALAMIEDAEKSGKLKPGMLIVEPTSGNTGVGLAMVAAVKGYKLILVMPESFSVERRKLMSVYGAEFVLTPREGGMKAALDKAIEIVQNDPNAWMPSQFDNPSNVDAHRRTTAQEIINDFPEGIDYLISGVGTGGHLSGVAEVLKSKFPKLKVFAVEPELSPLISGGKAAPHPIQGIGANFIPDNLNRSILDGVITISKDEAYEYTRKAATHEGMLVGISSGASLAAVAKKLIDIPKGSRVLTFTYDTGERYFSVEGLF
jgi:cysteine synthase A